jgi:hypothetical protein
MTEARSGEGKRRLFRFTAFRVGLLAGAVSFLVGAGLLHAAMAPIRLSGFNVDVVSTGADVSRNGGVTLIIRNRRGSLTQICNGACDNLHYQATDDENDYEVRVLDARGACVACDKPRGIMGGYGAWSHRWVIAGEHPLKIVVSDRIGGLAWKAAGEVRSH